jgi:hypothetical protein
MRTAPLLLAVLAAFQAGCGDDAPAGDADASVPPDAPSGPLIDQLRGLPGMVSVTEEQTEHAGYRRFDLRLTQPVDHADPDGATFTQQMTLFHIDETAPFVLLTTGYSNYYGDNLGELTRLLGANQLVVEHRYFASSRPEDPDWTQLTIENAAADHHVIRELLYRIYRGKWLATGASKGGMTSIYHRRFWPDDVDGTVPYVAPLSFGAPDYRYDTFVDQIGTAACRQALQDLSVELLTNRRAMLTTRAQAQADAEGFTYSRVPLGAAVEGAAAGIYWAFWQYWGIRYCADVPAPTASDDDVWSFLDAVSGVSGSADSEIAPFEAYYFQAEYELGYPGTMDEWLDGLLQFGGEDYDGYYPVGVEIPPFRAGAMEDIDQWVQSEGSELLFVYGEWDPWTGGQFELGAAADSVRLTVPEATHGARLARLPAADRDLAFAKLEAWTGVTPDLGALGARRAEPYVPRVPGAMIHALKLRRR